MFNKKCPKCEKKLEKTYDFCPSCGMNLKSKYDDEDYGFLGKNDFINKDTTSMLNTGGSFLDKIINNAMKMIEKQMQEMPNNFEQNINKTFSKMPSNMRIKFMVNGKEIPLGQANEAQKQQTQKSKKISLSEQQKNQLAKLPRKEPKITMKRFSEKVIYEIKVPGVNDIEDIIINKLENSIEVKAISKTKIYSKNININLPILRYFLDNENIILELKAK